MSQDTGTSETAADAPDLAWFEARARETVARFPSAMADAASSVMIQAAEWPDDRMLSDLGLSDGRDLTGLYDGVPLTEKSVFDQPLSPDQVWLFRGPILLEYEDRGNVTLEALVAHVTVHEFAHHFGWTDEDIAAIDPWWD